MKRRNERGAESGGRANPWQRAALIVVTAVVVVAGHAQNAPNRPQRGAPIDSAPQTNAVSSESRHQSPPAAPGTKAAKDEYAETGFDILSRFIATVTYEVVDADKPGFYYAPKLTTAIPDDIKGLDGKKVAVAGFMLPLRQEQGLVTEFILLKSRMFCCFGKPPQVNEWVHVRMKGEGVKTLMDQPVTICGRLKVAEYKENRTLLGIYQMEGEKMTGPQ